jgi:hypothetical protein
MRLGQWIIVLVVIGMYGLTSAEFYRYVDEEGKVKYTDNLANVPVDQRPKAYEYDESYDQFAPEEEIEREKPETESPDGALKEAEEVRLQREALAKEGEEKTLEQKLREAGARLRQEYQALMKEKEELDKIATRRLTETERKELIKKVRDYNLQTEDYEKRRQAFDKEVEAYNTSIKEKEQEPM